MIKSKYISRILIETPYDIFLCKSNAQFKSELEQRNISKKLWPDWVTPGRDGTLHIFLGNDNNIIGMAVCIKSKKNIPKASIIGLIIHESVHIWQKIKEDINEKDPSYEFEAYSIQRIAQELITAYF